VIAENALENALETLLAKEAIRDVLLRYSFEMDRRDHDVLVWPGAGCLIAGCLQ
jgi:hypothetical protein